MKILINLFILALFTSCLEQDAAILSNEDPFSLINNEKLILFPSEIEPNGQRSLSQLLMSSFTLLESYTSISNDIFAGSLDYTVDYEAFFNNKNDLNDYFSLLSQLKTVALKKTEKAEAINLYNYLSVGLVLTYFEELDGDVWTDGHSLLNIENRGEGIFKDLKFRFSDGYFSLENIENYIVSEVGPLAHLSLHRAAKGFTSDLSEIYTIENVQNKLELLAIELVNDQNIVYIDLDTNGSIISIHSSISEVFSRSFNFDPLGRFQSVHELIAYFNNPAMTSINSDDFLQKDEQGFLWQVRPLNVFIDWTLNQTK